MHGLGARSRGRPRDRDLGRRALDDQRRRAGGCAGARTTGAELRDVDRRALKRGDRVARPARGGLVAAFGSRGDRDDGRRFRVDARPWRRPFRRTRRPRVRGAARRARTRARPPRLEVRLGSALGAGGSGGRGVLTARPFSVWLSAAAPSAPTPTATTPRRVRGRRARSASRARRRTAAAARRRRRRSKLRASAPGASRTSAALSRRVASSIDSVNATCLPEAEGARRASNSGGRAAAVSRRWRGRTPSNRRARARARRSRGALRRPAPTRRTARAAAATRRQHVVHLRAAVGAREPSGRGAVRGSRAMPGSSSSSSTRFDRRGPREPTLRRHARKILLGETGSATSRGVVASEDHASL